MPHKTPKRLHNPTQQKKQLHLRLLISYVVVISMFTLLIGRLVWLQYVEHQRYATLAQSNSISLPNRGMIMDRNGVVLAQNHSAYSLELTPSKIADLPATIQQLGQLVTITPGDRRRFNKLRADSHAFASIPLKVNLTDKEAAILAAHTWRFPGMQVKAQLFRDYPFGALTSHLLGYVSRINQKDQEELQADGQSSNYPGSTYIGKVGLEHAYEQELHGHIGFQEIETNSTGHALRILHDTPPVSGDTLKLTLDIRLQEVADKLFGNRRGALVAIDPRNGNVLAFLSKPGFNPALFVDGIDVNSWNQLNQDWQKPLINRALRGLYPPGSTLKPLLTMGALASGTISMNTLLPAPSVFYLPGSKHQFRDVDGDHGIITAQRAIAVSSDTFFYRLAWMMGIDKIDTYLAQFGLGSRTGIDLDDESTGILPGKAWKARRFARYGPTAQRWLPGDVISIGIGQGYNAYTPLQMASAIATLSEDGIRYRPHLVAAITDPDTGKTEVIGTSPESRLPFPRADFEYVKQGMVEALQTGGTAARAGIGLRYGMGGKTGTAQVIGIKQGARYHASATPELQRDHAWFVAFAPVEHPRIAVAVIVENAGFGGQAAAPIARQLFDFYLTGKIPAGISTALKNDTLPIVDPSDKGKAALHC